MSDPNFHTTLLHEWLDRIRAGDHAVRDELFKRIGGRLEHLARKMLKQFPNVQAYAETGDVLQNAVMRLLRGLERVRPASVREFYGLAALYIRRELLDLARHYALQHQARPAGSLRGDDSQGPGIEPIAAEEDPDQFEKWCLFHETVEQLPAEEREVVGLIFYNGWKQTEVAEFFGVDERTIRRRWDRAMTRLHSALNPSEQL